MVNYDDITECIELYKKFIYGNDKQHYRYEEIRKDAITLTDLKKPAGFTMPSNVGALKFMFSTHNEHWFSCDLPVIIRIKADDDSIADIKATYLLGGLTVNDPIKFVLLSLMNFDLPAAQLSAVSKQLPVADTYLVKISEAFQPYVPLKRWLDKEHERMEDDDWRALIFELIYPLYKITKSYKFRHNRYTVNAVYISSASPIKKEYTVKTIKYVVPSLGVKIAHFDNCHIEDVIKSDTQFCENFYYDVFTMIQSLRTYNPPNETLTFMNQIIPEKYRSSVLDEVYYRQTVDHVWSPDKVLTVNFFNPFIEEMSSELSRGSVDLGQYISEQSLTHNSEPIGLAVKINSTRSNMTVHGMRTLNTVRPRRGASKKQRRNLEELSALTVSEGSASPVEQPNFMEMFGSREGAVSATSPLKEKALSSTSFISSLGETPLTVQQSGAEDDSSSSSSSNAEGGANKLMRSLLKSHKKSKKSKKNAYSHLLSNVSAAYEGAVPYEMLGALPAPEDALNPQQQQGFSIPADMMGMTPGVPGMNPQSTVQQFLPPPMPGATSNGAPTGVQQFLPPAVPGAVPQNGNVFFQGAAATK